MYILRCLCLVVLAASSFGLRAQYVNSVPYFDQADRLKGWRVIYPNGGGGAGDVVFERSFAGPGLGPASSGTPVRDVVQLRTPGGTAFPATVTRTIPKAGAIAAMARVLGGPAGIAVAVLPLLYEAAREAGVDTSSGEPRIDPGKGKEISGGLMHDFRTGTAMPPGSIAAREASRIQQDMCGDGTFTCAVRESSGSCSNNTCSWRVTVDVLYQSGSKFRTDGGADTGPELTALICKQTTLAPLRFQYPPAGTAECSSDQRVKPNATQWEKILERTEITPRVIEEVAPKIPIPADNPTATGPTTVTDPPKVTTKPDGTTVTETKKYDITYNQNTITYNTTNITNNEGDITTVENPDSPNACQTNPNSAGCAELGNAPEVDMPGKEVTTNPAPQTGWGASEGSCPAPKVVMVQGRPVTIDNSILCQFLSGIRFAVVGAFGIAAVLVFVGGLKD